MEESHVVKVKYCESEDVLNEFLTRFQNGKDLINITYLPAPAAQYDTEHGDIKTNIIAIVQYWDDNKNE